MSARAASTHLPWTHLKSRPNSVPKKHRRHDKVLWLIGAGKIFYGLILLAVGIGTLNLVGKNLTTELWRWVQWWNVDFHNHYIQMLFRQVSTMDGHRLYLLAFVTMAYAAVFLSKVLVLSSKNTGPNGSWWLSPALLSLRKFTISPGSLTGLISVWCFSTPPPWPIWSGGLKSTNIRINPQPQRYGNNLRI